MTRSPKTAEPTKTSHSRPVLSTAGVSLFAILCCAGPALIASGVAAGALGAFGAWISSPWVIVIAVAVAALAAAGLWHRRRRPGIRPARGRDRCATPQTSHHLTDRAK